MTDQKTEIMVLGEETLSLANPKQILEFGQVLKHYIEKNGLSTKIQGKSYANVDGWKFAGMNFGLTARPKKPTKKHNGEYIKIGYHIAKFSYKNSYGNKIDYEKEVPFFVGFANDHNQYRAAAKGLKVTRTLRKLYYAYECDCDIIRLSDDKLINYGHGYCDNLEVTKSSFDQYAIDSMSQTRSIGKAYRNLIGHVMNAAGFETTPSEEMDHVKAEEVADIADILVNIPLMTNQKELVNYYNGLEENFKRNKAIQHAFKKRELEIKAKK